MNLSPDELPESPKTGLKPEEVVPVWGRAPSPVQAERSSADASGDSGSSKPSASQLADEGPPDPVWDGLDVLRIALMLIVALVVSLLAMLAVVPGPTIKARLFRLGASPALAIVGQMLAYFLLLGYMYFLVTKERHSARFWKAIHWNWPVSVWPFLTAGLVLQIVFVLLERFLPFPKETPFDDLLQRHAAIVLISVFSVTLGPLMEELFFRGFLYPVLARRFGMVAGVVVTALGFGLLHAAQYGYSWASVLLISVVGVVLGVVRAREDSVAAGFVVHAAYNGTIILMLLIATDGFRHLEKLNQ